MKMQWNVYRYDFNSKSIVKFNIFNHGRFSQDVEKDLKVCKTKEEFTEKLKKHLMYYYWAKCEYEVVITSWPLHITTEEFRRIEAEYDEWESIYGHHPRCIDVNPAVGSKIDIYEQIMTNYDIFVDYVWSHKGAAK